MNYGVNLPLIGFPFWFSNQINAIQMVLMSSKTEEEGIGSESADPDVLIENTRVSEGSHKIVSDAVDENVEKGKYRTSSLTSDFMDD
jgi:hypothetical protein